MINQRQLKAIFAKNKKKGLRKTITALRSKGHRASDWRTLYHVTPNKNIPSIKKKGLIPKGGQGWFERLYKDYPNRDRLDDPNYTRSQTWLGNTSAAQEMIHELKRYRTNPHIIKVRIAKKDLIKGRNYLGIGEEFKTRATIPPDNFRGIKRIRRLRVQAPFNVRY